MYCDRLTLNKIALTFFVVMNDVANCILFLFFNFYLISFYLMENQDNEESQTVSTISDHGSLTVLGTDRSETFLKMNIAQITTVTELVLHLHVNFFTRSFKGS